MFGHRSHLPVDLYFPMIRGMEKHWCVDCCIAELCEWLWEAFKEAWAQSTFEAERQKQYYDRKANAILLETGNLVLAKANAYKGKSNVKDWWEKELYEVECQVTDDVPLYLIKNKQQYADKSSAETDLSSSLLQGALLFVWLCNLSRQGAPPLPYRT